jgi:hypothetical protein
MHQLTCLKPLRSLPPVFQNGLLWWRLKLLALLSVPLPALIWPLLHPATAGAWLAVDRSSPAALDWGLPSPFSTPLPPVFDGSAGGAARSSTGMPAGGADDGGMDAVTAMRRDALALGGLVQWFAVGAVIAYFATYARDFVVLEAAHEALANARTPEAPQTQPALCQSGDPRRVPQRQAASTTSQPRLASRQAVGGSGGRGRSPSARVGVDQRAARRAEGAVAASRLAVTQLQDDARLSVTNSAMLAPASVRTREGLCTKGLASASRGSRVSRSRSAGKASKKGR